MLRPVFALLAMTAAIGHSTHLMAQQSGGTTAESVKKYDAQTMRPEDIRKCLKDGQKLDQQEQAGADYRATVTEFLGKINKLTESLKLQRVEIDNTDADAVKDYNSRVENQQQMIARYKERMLPQLNQREAQLSKSIERYNKRCSGKKYFEDDWVAAVKELGIEDPRDAAKN